MSTPSSGFAISFVVTCKIDESRQEIEEACRLVVVATFLYHTRIRNYGRNSYTTLKEGSFHTAQRIVGSFSSVRSTVIVSKHYDCILSSPSSLSLSNTCPQALSIAHAWQQDFFFYLSGEQISPRSSFSACSGACTALNAR